MEEYLRMLSMFEWKCAGDDHKLPFAGIGDFLLDQGVDYQSAPLSLEQQKVLAHRVQISLLSFEPKQCFYNAQLFVMGACDDRFTYCEGYAAGRVGIPLLHAWVLMDDKHVIDLTWRTGDDLSQPWEERVVGAIPEGWEYRGVTIDRKTLYSWVFGTNMAQSFLGTPELALTLFANRERKKEPICLPESWDSLLPP